ncbi:MAG: hypothetical protein MJE66_08965 [Proteobacteria bacterium]|nr:hypothetical protein [Pseudomonadota bacterium]
MLRIDASAGREQTTELEGFVLYVEGPRDREILRVWARHSGPGLAQTVQNASVILGGRQPVRAATHFQSLGGAGAGLRALCVLDRDGVEGDELPREPGLEFFTWGRRHIESYLLVPEAIRRSLRLPRDDSRVERLLREHVPDHDEQSWRALDAKRLLATRGPLSQELGTGLSPGRIARAMRAGELHEDVRDLFERLARRAKPASGRPT